MLKTKGIDFLKLLKDDFQKNINLKRKFSFRGCVCEMAVSQIMSTDDERRLWRAAEKGDTATLTSLIQKGICPNFYQVSDFK